MKTKLFSLISLLAFTLSISAQDARSILDKAAETYNKAGGVIASFTLDSKDTKAKLVYSYDGKAYMKGDKFKIEIPDAITWLSLIHIYQDIRIFHSFAPLPSLRNN